MIDLSTIIRFIMQLGLAVAGAASLWSLFLHYRIRKAKDGAQVQSLQKLADFLVPIFTLGLIVFALSWIILKDVFYPILLGAHEGINIKPTLDYIQNGLAATSLPVMLLLVAGAVLVYLFKRRRSTYSKYSALLFGAIFVLVSVIDALLLWTDSFNNLQAFYFLHHWHSIFTLGTVITVDYFYLRTMNRDDLKKAVYPLFPFLSAVIWAGLGLDFLSSLLIFNQAFAVNTQFLFVQTVIAIIILNGALMSGRINERLMATIRPENPLPLSQKERKLLGVSGAVSISSWLTIAFVDLFSFGLKYWQFFAYYLFVIAVAFTLHQLVDKKFRNVKLKV